MMGPALRQKWQYSAKRIKVAFEAGGGAPGFIRTGTGFILLDDRAMVVLVTNAHLLDATRGKKPHYGYHVAEIEIESWKKPDGQDAPTELLFATAHFTKESSRILVSAQDDVAVASFTLHEHRQSDAIRMGNVVSPNSSGCFLGHWTIQSSELASDDYLAKHLAIGSQVGIFGFPALAGLETNRPIGSFGPVASDPRVQSPIDKAPGRAVLYQTLSFMGMSGGPVIADEIGIRMAGHGPSDFYQPPTVVGINAGHLTDSQGRHAGLSYFYRADAIRDLVNRLPSPTIRELRHLAALPQDIEKSLSKVAEHYTCHPEDLTLEQFNAAPTELLTQHD